MSNLLDTNIVSQRVKLEQDERVVRWLSAISEADMFLSVISLEEIRLGIEQIPQGRKRERLELWLTQDLRAQFAERLLMVDDRIAEEAGLLVAKSKKSGAEAELGDALIAATAKVHGLKVATLNRKHFLRLGVELVEF